MIEAGEHAIMEEIGPESLSGAFSVSSLAVKVYRAMIEADLLERY